MRLQPKLSKYLRMHGCKCKYIKYCELKYYSVFQIEHSTNYATITLDIYTVCEYYFTWL